ncbi:MAG: GABA permease, partial [Actinobacteria bacterium]|nr:GABA permease [Actinomycetota bacterium]
LMATVILAMAFLPGTRSQFLMSGVTLLVILGAFEVVRRRAAPVTEDDAPAPADDERLVHTLE